MNPDGPSDPWLKLVQAALFSGQNPLDAIPAEADPALAAEWRQVIETLAGLHQLAASLSQGDLSLEVRLRGALAGSLKTLQADLRHLTWQVQQVAAGDLTQRVDFMGNFAAAFNLMTQNLRQARDELQASESRYRFLAENAQDVIWILDPVTLRFTYVSPSVYGLRGYTADEVLQQQMDQVLTPESLRVIQGFLSAAQEFSSAASNPFGRVVELEQPCKDGSTVWTEVTTTPLFDDEGRLVNVLGVSRNISERRRARQAEAEKRLLAETLRDTAAALNSAMTLEAVLDSLLANLGRVVPHERAMILLIDADQVAYPTRWTGFDPQESAAMQDIRLPIVLTPNLRQMVESGRPCSIPDVRDFDWQATPVSTWVRSYLGVPIMVDGCAVGFLSMYSLSVDFFSPDHIDRLAIFANQAAVAIQKARLIEELQRLATTDPLTGAPNRRHFFDRADAEFSRALRYGSPLSAVMLDVDFFKRVNDTYGHAVGDDVLTQLVHTCLTGLRQVDIFGRYGGEEFAILLPNTDLQHARIAAERLRAACAARRFTTAAGSLPVTISIGVTEYQAGCPSLQALLNQADQALYAAKQAGRNCVRIFGE